MWLVGIFIELEIFVLTGYDAHAAAYGEQGDKGNGIKYVFDCI